MAKRGPKPVLTPQLIQQARRMAEMGLRKLDIAKIAGVRGDTLSKWQKAHPELKQALIDGKKACDHKVVNALFRAATTDRDVRAQIFWLKNRQPDDWKDKVDLDHSGDVVKQIVLVNPEGEQVVNKLALAMAKLPPPLPKQGRCHIENNES